jgi:hypothetical protein
MGRGFRLGGLIMIAMTMRNAAVANIARAAKL